MWRSGGVDKGLLYTTNNLKLVVVVGGGGGACVIPMYKMKY